MSTADGNPRQRAWSAYWSSGSLHSCATAGGGNYTGAIAWFWDDLLDRARRPLRMLDLATGNGALPKRAMERAGIDAIEIDAVDLASVSPAWLPPGAASRVRFHAGVAMECLPFEDASFDLVTSQYGIEYARWPDALHEALRTRRDDGVMGLVLHHAGSVLVDVGRQETSNLSYLLNADGLLPAARQVLPWLAMVANGGKGAEDGQRGQGDMAAARAAYNHCMQRIGDALVGNRAPDVLLQARQQVHALLADVRAGKVGRDAATRVLDGSEQLLEAARLRTNEMLECALDQDAVDALRNLLQRARPDADVTVTELRQAEGVMGWGVVVAPALRSRTSIKGARSAS